MKKFYIVLLMSTLLSAQLLITPVESMNMAFGGSVEITKKNTLLSKKDAKRIQNIAKVKLNSKIFRIFTAKEDSTIVGYGILINQKVRSKNAVIMYHITNLGLLKSVEVVSFNEPLEYLPSKTWNSQFKDRETDKMLRVSKDIPTITGATLSARAITDASRVAFAIYTEILKKKQ